MGPPQIGLIFPTLIVHLRCLPGQSPAPLNRHARAAGTLGRPTAQQVLLTGCGSQVGAPPLPAHPTQQRSQQAQQRSVRRRPCKQRYHQRIQPISRRVHWRGAVWWVRVSVAQMLMLRTHQLSPERRCEGNVDTTRQGVKQAALKVLGERRLATLACRRTAAVGAAANPTACAAIARTLEAGPESRSNCETGWAWGSLGAPKPPRRPASTLNPSLSPPAHHMPSPPSFLSRRLTTSLPHPPPRN